MGRVVAAALASLAGAGLAFDAGAHAPPLAARVLAAGAGEELIVTNRGLVFRELATGEARLLCNEALRVSTAELPNVAFGAGGGLIVAGSGGLRQTRDRGCTWSDVGGMQNANTPALAQDPNDTATLFVARYDGDSPGISSSRDAGASWSLVLATPPEDYVRSLLVAAADSRYVYATLTTFAAGLRPSHALLRSSDGGASWQRLPLPLLATDNAAFVAAASPADPGRLVLYTVGNSPGLDHGRLLSSADAGNSFVVSLELPEIRAASFSQDGRLWVAARDGLYVAHEMSEPGGVSDAAAEAGGAFERVSDATELGCVQERDGVLLVCGHYAGALAGSGIGVLEVAGQHFESLLDFGDVAEPVSCPEDSLSAALCAAPWRDWQAELLGGSSGGSALAPAGAGGSSGAGPANAGSVEAGAGSASEPSAASPTPSVSAGPAVACTVTAGAAPPPAWPVALVLGLLGLRRRPHLARSDLRARRRGPPSARGSGVRLDRH